MTKVPHPFLTIRLPEDEKAILDAYCYDTRQTKTDVLRQFIRGLKHTVVVVGTSLSEMIASLTPERQERIQVRIAQIINEESYDDNLDEGLWKVTTDITQVENEILEEYCYETKQKKSDVIRSLICGLQVGERAPVGEFELIDSASVATVARQLRTLADQLEGVE